MNALTDIQASVLAALRRRAEQGDAPPSYRELCAEFGWSSTGTARDHLRALSRKGYVDLPCSRGGRVRLREVVRGRAVPVVGRIAAGVPVATDEHVEGWIPIPENWAVEDGTGCGGVFALEVAGESMKEAGILDGDHVVVQRGEAAESGSIVAATIDGETTLKRLVKRGRRVWLLPENPDYEPIPVRTESAVIHGTVVGLLRSYPAGPRAARLPRRRAASDRLNRSGGRNARGT